MRFDEVGQQLRNYRLESGLKADEIAARLGISRAALYRYEKGEVIKLDTVRRLAEMLQVSPLALLGIGVDYFSRINAFWNVSARLRKWPIANCSLVGRFVLPSSRIGLISFCASFGWKQPAWRLTG